MSDILEKTIASLPSILTGTKSSSTSRGFQTFVKHLANIKSKHEEEQFIKKEVSIQKQRLSQPNLSTVQMREVLVRLLYCHMLGYPVTFAYIHAVKLAQQGSMLEKRVGYLMSALLLHEQHELVMLLINTVQKDLRSSNMLEVCMALTASSQLMSADMIPALLPLVEEKLKHPKDMVRKKAVLCLHSFYMKAPDLLAHSAHNFQGALCDRDPGVMWAALHYYLDAVKIDPNQYGTLTQTFIGILDQVMGRRLSSDFEYHSVPAPWLQITLLKILAKLGHQNEGRSQQMYPILREILQRTDPSHKIGLALISECLETILRIWPNESLIEHAAHCIGKFLSSNNNNLKYLGLKALASVVQISPSYAVEHQDIVIDCLEHEDLTIQRKTLDLLYRMANEQNAAVICSRLLAHLTHIADAHVRSDLMTKVIDVAQRYNTDSCWYVNIVTRVLLLSKDTSPPPSAATYLRQMLQRETDDVYVVRKHAFTTFWRLLQMDDVPPVLLQMAAWVVGEYCDINTEVEVHQVANLLVDIFNQSEGCIMMQTAVLGALLKIAMVSSLPLSLIDQLKYDGSSENTSDVKQRLKELHSLTRLTEQGLHIQDHRVPINQLDLSLSFLDDYVAEKLEEGCQAYKPACWRQSHLSKTQEATSLFAGLSFHPYNDASLAGSMRSDSSASFPPGNVTFDSDDTPSDSIKSMESSGLKVEGVRQVWGKEGVITHEEEDDLYRSMNKPKSLEKAGPDSQIPPSSSPHQPEVEKVAEKRQELASALFSGIPSSAQRKTSFPRESSPVPGFSAASSPGHPTTPGANPSPIGSPHSIVSPSSSWRHGPNTSPYASLERSSKRTSKNTSPYASLERQSGRKSKNSSPYASLERPSGRSSRNTSPYGSLERPKKRDPSNLGSQMAVTSSSSGAPSNRSIFSSPEYSLPLQSSMRSGSPLATRRAMLSEPHTPSPSRASPSVMSRSIESPYNSPKRSIFYEYDIASPGSACSPSMMNPLFREGSPLDRSLTDWNFETNTSSGASQDSWQQVHSRTMSPLGSPAHSYTRKEESSSGSAGMLGTGDLIPPPMYSSACSTPDESPPFQ